MLNHTNSTMDSDSHQTHRPSMAWFLPTFVGVFMTIFLLVSWILHHRRFRERHKHKELLEYYLELQVDCGRRRVAAPSTSSSMRTNEEEVDFNRDSRTIVSVVARSSLDPAISIAINENGTGLTAKKKKRGKKVSKVTHKDSEIFKLFGMSSEKSFRNGECSSVSEESGSMRPLPPIISEPSPNYLPTSGTKDMAQRAQSDPLHYSGRHVTDDSSCPGENKVVLLKMNSLQQPLNNIQETYKLDTVKHEQSLV